MPSSTQNISMQEFLQGQQSNSHKDREESPEPTNQQSDGVSMDPQETKEDEGPRPAFSIHDFFWYKLVIGNRTHVMQSYDIKFSDPNLPIKRVNAEYITPEVIESFWKDIKEKTTAADNRANADGFYVAVSQEIHDRACLRKRQELEAAGHTLTTGFVGVPETNHSFTYAQRDVFGKIRVTPGKIRPDPMNHRGPDGYVDKSPMAGHEQVEEEPVAAPRNQGRRAVARRFDVQRAVGPIFDHVVEEMQRFHARRIVPADPVEVEDAIAELRVAAAALVIPDERNPGEPAAAE